jgi:hypothetical protein
MGTVVFWYLARVVLYNDAAVQGNVIMVYGTEISLSSLVLKWRKYVSLQHSCQPVTAWQ